VRNFIGNVTDYVVNECSTFSYWLCNVLFKVV